MSTGRAESRDSENEDFVYTSSGSEFEEWGNDESEEWEVDNIYAEHTNTRGEKRFKVGWTGWQREDGTTWTWERENSIVMDDISSARHPIILKNWRKKQARTRMAQAENKRIPPFRLYREPDNERPEKVEKSNSKRKKPSPSSMHALFTELHQQMEEMGVYCNEQEEDEDISSFIATSQHLFKLRKDREEALFGLDMTIDVAASNSLLGLGLACQENSEQQLPLDKELSQLNMFESFPQFEWKKGSRTLKRSNKGSSMPSQSMSNSLESQPSHTKLPGVELPSVTPKSVNLGFQVPNCPIKKLPIQPQSVLSEDSSSFAGDSLLKSQWLAGSRQVVATPSNTTTQMKIQARGLAPFVYLKQDYVYGEGIPRPQPGFMQSCECEICYAGSCSCQEDSEIQDDTGSPAFAYNKQGLFTFNDITSYIVECNKNCKCGPSCQSRVSQRPCTIPVEIFKTRTCGWGVRSRCPIEKGTVLGVYTGLLIHRETAQKLAEIRGSNNFIFDLDFMDEISTSQYSVDSSEHGNWTRFINHSCEPTCTLFPVVWDSIPAMHQPKLAFVAVRDIPVGMELTIDYCPQATKAKGKSRATSPTCRCETETCRGYIYM